MTDGDVSCELSRSALAHEMGHALGIGLNPGEDYGATVGYPLLEQDSLMSNPFPNRDLHCRPQPYDVVAVMAAYQYRVPEPS